MTYAAPSSRHARATRSLVVWAAGSVQEGPPVLARLPKYLYLYLRVLTSPPQQGVPCCRRPTPWLFPPSGLFHVLPPPSLTPSPFLSLSLSVCPCSRSSSLCLPCGPRHPWTILATAPSPRRKETLGEGERRTPQPVPQVCTRLWDNLLWRNVKKKKEKEINVRKGRKRGKKNDLCLKNSEFFCFVFLPDSNRLKNISSGLEEFPWNKTIQRSENFKRKNNSREGNLPLQQRQNLLKLFAFGCLQRELKAKRKPETKATSRRFYAFLFVVVFLTSVISHAERLRVSVWNLTPSLQVSFHTSIPPSLDSQLAPNCTQLFGEETGSDFSRAQLWSANCAALATFLHRVVGTQVSESKLWFWGRAPQVSKRHFCLQYSQPSPRRRVVATHTHTRLWIRTSVLGNKRQQRLLRATILKTRVHSIHKRPERPACCVRTDCNAFKGWLGLVPCIN